MATGKDRQRQLAREHHERQLRRRSERERKSKRAAVVGSTIGVIAVVGGIVAAMALLGGDPKSTAAADPASSPTATPENTGAQASGPKPFDAKSNTCDYVADAAGAVKKVGLPARKIDPKRLPGTLTFHTGQGEIEVKLNTAKAPCTVNALAFLAKKGYYDGSKCHRLGNDGFPMLQCGDPLAKADGKNPTDGQGGPGFRMAEEGTEGATYKRGVMAMAKTMEPGTTGSQFFLVYGDIGLSPDYTPVGTIIKGLDILDKVNKAGVITPGAAGDGTGAPKESVEIKSVTTS